MAGYSSGVVPVGPAQHPGQGQGQQQAGLASQPHMSMQQQQHSSSSQQMRQMSLQQPGSAAYSQAMYAALQPGMMRQQQQLGAYPNSMPQGYPSNASELSSRPMSPPGLPRGPSQALAQTHRSQVRSPTGGYLGPQMIRPQAVGSQMMANQMLASQAGGNQMAGNWMTSSPRSPSAARPSSPGVASGGSSSGAQLASSHPQLRPQPGNSGSSRPNSTSSHEGSGSAGQGQGPLFATNPKASDQSQQAGLRYQGGQGGVQMQPGYASSPFGMSLNTGKGSHLGLMASFSQTRQTYRALASPGCGSSTFWVTFDSKTKQTYIALTTVCRWSIDAVHALAWH